MCAKLSVIHEKFKFLRFYLAKFAASFGGFLVPLVGFFVIFFCSPTLLVTFGNKFLMAALIRALRTFAQATIGMIAVGSAFADSLLLR